MSEEAMKKNISLVIPVYNESANLVKISEEIDRIFQKLDYDYELIFVNDGSRDDSFLQILSLSQVNKKIKCLDFARNFGKEIALSAGCHSATGDAVITLDADLQHPPSLIPDFIKKWEEGFDVVYGVRKENKGASAFKKFTSRIYWVIFTHVSSVNTEPHSTDFRLIDKKVASVFRQFPERARLYRGIVDWMGYKRTRVLFTADARFGGEAVYSYRNLFRLAIDSFTSFSLLPLRFAGYVGLLITSISFILLIVMLFTRWFVNSTVFTPIAIFSVLNTFLIGIVLVSLGFIALYIARIHDEVIGRPLYIVREKINIK